MDNLYLSTVKHSSALKIHNTNTIKKLLSTNAVPYSSSLSSRLDYPRDSASLKLQGRPYQRMAPL